MQPFPGADRATAQLLQCLVTSDFLHQRARPGHPEQLEVDHGRLLRFQPPDLTTTGSRIRVIVVDSSPVSYDFPAVPMERHDLISGLDRATASLRAGG